MTTVAIMQPTYLPWLGYFALMDRVDTFVYLDSVQFARRSWQQRNRIRSADGEVMLTIPVAKKGLRDQKIAEVEILYSSEFPRRHVDILSANYRRADILRYIRADAVRAAGRRPSQARRPHDRDFRMAGPSVWHHRVSRQVDDFEQRWHEG